jgi:hypothetical protein
MEQLSLLTLPISQAWHPQWQRQAWIRHRSPSPCVSGGQRRGTRAGTSRQGALGFRQSPCAGRLWVSPRQWPSASHPQCTPCRRAEEAGRRAAGKPRSLTCERAQLDSPTRHRHRRVNRPEPTHLCLLWSTSWMMAALRVVCAPHVTSGAPASASPHRPSCSSTRARGNSCHFFCCWLFASSKKTCGSSNLSSNPHPEAPATP